MAAGIGSAPPIVHGLKNTLLPCPTEAYDTLQRIKQLAPQGQVGVSMNCVINPVDNTIRGWHCMLPPTTPIQCIPFQPNMFEGITVCETLATENQVLELLKNRSETLHKIEEFASLHSSENVDNRVSWKRCRPNRSTPLQRTEAWRVLIRHENLNKYMRVNGGFVHVADNAPIEHVPDDTIPNYIDGDDWSPELGSGGFIGLYHQWYTTSDSKHKLKLYIVCQSSCQKAGIELKHIINDISDHTNVGDLARSEEIWWLSNVNVRNNNRLIMALARELNIQIPCIQDYHATSATARMAQPLVHSFLYGLYTHQSGQVSFANECIPTNLVHNGIVCKMAPWEGVWVFKGPHTNSSGGFGTSFGNITDLFPLTSVQLTKTSEPVARRMQYIIQNASSYENDTWADLGTPASHRFMDELEAFIEDDNTTPEDETEKNTKEHLVTEEFGAEQLAKIDASTFGHFSDPDLQDIAITEWKSVKLRTLMNAARASNPQNTNKQNHFSISETYEQTYISFEDSNIMNRLRNVNWDPRYGILKLIPLAVVTAL